MEHVYVRFCLRLRQINLSSCSHEKSDGGVTLLYISRGFSSVSLGGNFACLPYQERDNNVFVCINQFQKIANRREGTSVVSILRGIDVNQFTRSWPIAVPPGRRQAKRRVDEYFESNPHASVFRLCMRRGRACDGRSLA